MSALGSIHIDGEEKIGRALKNTYLRVPANQRDYAWENKHVLDLFQDLAQAINVDGGEYFLGTIVVVHDKKSDGHYVVDGQQRLATSVILIGAIRDYLEANGESSRAKTIDDRYLMSMDETTDTSIERLHLNDGDHPYFYRRVLLRENSEERKSVKPSRPSHRLIDAAAKLAANHVRDIVATVAPANRAQGLLRWVTFLLEKARVIWVTVEDDRAAYVIFETMNDRGLELSATDLIKNYLFGKAGGHYDQVKHQWTSMLSVLEGAQIGDIVKDYVRHYWIAFHEATRNPELFGRVKRYVTGETRATQFSTDLSESAPRYIALLNPLHPAWALYPERTKKNVSTLVELGMTQLRPLLLAAMQRLDKKEIPKVLRLAVSWCVRFLITGAIGSGALEGHYGRVARDIANSKITSGKDLAREMTKIVPDDKTFENFFASARVSKPSLARYYLRSLEASKANDPEPENIINDDTVITLEHILPENPSNGWPHFSAEEQDQYLKRLGNYLLLQATPNSKIGNEPFAVKRPYYKASKIKLTQQVGSKSSWTPKDIDERQKELAQLAVKTWPLNA